MLISQVEESSSYDIGEPNCKLIEPFVVKGEYLEPWLLEYTDSNAFMIHADKILTMFEPNSKILKKYKNSIK